MIKPTAVRNAKVDLGHVTFNDTWVVGPITAPLLSLGKLYRQGFTVGRVNDELTLYREGDAMNGVPVYPKRNSLCVCVRGSHPCGGFPSQRGLECIPVSCVFFNSPLRAS